MRKLDRKARRRGVVRVRAAVLLAAGLLSVCVSASAADAEPKREHTVSSPDTSPVASLFGVDTGCVATSKELWNSLDEKEKKSLKDFVRANHISLLLPDIVTAIQLGKDSEAVALVKRYYSADDKLAGEVLTLIADVNGIKRKCSMSGKDNAAP